MQTAAMIDDLQRRVRWYVGVRWLYLLGISLPGVASLIISAGLTEQVWHNGAIVLGALLINAGFLALTYINLKSLNGYRALASLQVAFDLALMTAAFYLNGGIETPIAMLYAIPIVMSAAFFERHTILIVGIGATCIFAGLALLDFTEILPPQNVAAPQLHTESMNFMPTFATTIAILLAITIITTMVGRLIREREQLAVEMQTLSAHNAEIEAILRTMGSALVAVGPNGHITLVNNSFQLLTGWRQDDVIGRQINEVLPILDSHGHKLKPSEQPMRLFNRGVDLDKPLAVHSLTGYSYMRRDGSTFPFVAHMAPIVADNRVIGMTTVFDDATDSKKLDQLKDNFIALISHQLKTPIAELSGYSENLLSGIAGELSAKQAEYAAQIHEVALRSGKLVSDLLDIAVAGEGNLSVEAENIKLSPLLAEIRGRYHDIVTKKGLKLVVKPVDEDVYVRGDNAKLVQAIGNVVDNAVRYSEHGQITISCVPADKEVEIFVSDRGRGMDRATVDMLFGSGAGTMLSHPPTAEGGTGLGMFLSKQLIGLMGGDIHVVASTEKGTTICIKLRRMKS